MGLLSFFRRKPAGADAAPADAPDAVQTARTRARQRLIGAAVLVAAGIVGFPLVFETEPRPIPIDVPIEIPRKEGAAPLQLPAVRPADVAGATPPRTGTDAVKADPIITETVADAGREVLSPTSSPRATAPSAEAPRPKPKPAAAASAVVARTASAARPNADAARAQALLEGRATAALVTRPDAGASAPVAATAASGAGLRFIVQVGAFAGDPSAQETRSKVERLGLKTYTQVAETAAGKRIRVRIGPFASRDEAERAAAKLKSAALPAVVLAL